MKILFCVNNINKRSDNIFFRGENFPLEYQSSLQTLDTPKQSLGPLVAASLGMFSQGLDNELWHFVAFSAGTGGSMLIIGSAAGVVAMGMEKIDFFWYFKNISWLALIGFVVGSATFMITRTMF